MFQGFGSGSPSSVVKRTHLGQYTWVTRKGPSHLGESLLVPSWLRTRRSTRSSTWSSMLLTNRWW
jgi:hypothetical protein